MAIGIYLITNLYNGKKYVGQSWDIAHRWKVHRYSKEDYPLSRAIQKYGWDCFSKEILCKCRTQAALDRKEIAYIQLFMSTAPNGYNLAAGGNYGKHHPESIEKMRVKATGRKASDETRQKMSDMRRGKATTTGYKHSEESRQRMSESRMGNTNNLGKKRSPEEKERIAERSRNIGIETREKIGSATRLGWATMTEEARKARLAPMQQPRSEETKEKMRQAQALRRAKEKAEKAAIVIE